MRPLLFRNRAVPTSGRPICPGREYRMESLVIESSGNRIGTEVAPLLPKYRGTPLVDLFRGASFVGEISPLEDLALLLGKQGLTHFSAYWIRCKDRPAYITVNEPLTLSLSLSLSIRK